MKVPKGYTHQEVEDIITKISTRLANKFKFGYHEMADMRQQAALLALEGLDKYDEVRPLENFLWVHVHNRLFNFKRNNYGRPDKPCDKCPLGAYINHECTAYTNMMSCEYYFKWFNRNESKKNLMSTKEHADYVDHAETPVEDKVLTRDIFKLIDGAIPLAMREDWLRYSHGIKLQKSKREVLFTTILSILEENGIDRTQTW